MKIINLPIDEIIPYERNPRKNDGAVEAVAASIREFGFKVPIVVDSANVIVTGHTRHKAARKLGLSECPCIRADDLTPEQVRAYRLADNKVAELAEWDFDLLAGELEGLNFGGFGIDWGIDTDEPPPEVEDDDYDGDFETESGIGRGDMFALGRHRLLCGDSTSAEDAARLMGGEKAKILFTSPPYSDLREYDGDDMAVSNIVGFIAAFREHAAYQCVNLGLIRREQRIVPYWDEYIFAAEEQGLKMLAWNVWDKMECGSVGQQSAFIPLRHEWVFVFGTETFEINRTVPKQDASINANRMRTQRQKDGSLKKTTRGVTYHKYKKMESVFESVQKISPEKTREITKHHPAIMPVKLPGAYINAMTQPGDIVIDPFCGSGTTMIAAEQCGRSCRGMEISPKYCQVIIARWEQFTGRKAERIA